MAPAGANVSAALALASNSEIVVASNPMKNTRMMLFRRDQTTASIVRQQHSDHSASGSQSFCYANARSHPVLTSQTTKDRDRDRQVSRLTPLNRKNWGALRIVHFNGHFLHYYPSSRSVRARTALIVTRSRQRRFRFDIVTYELFGGLGRSDVRLAKSPKWGCALAT